MVELREGFCYGPHVWERTAIRGDGYQRLRCTVCGFDQAVEDADGEVRCMTALCYEYRESGRDSRVWHDLQPYRVE